MRHRCTPCGATERPPSGAGPRGRGGSRSAPRRAPRRRAAPPRRGARRGRAPRTYNGRAGAGAHAARVAVGVQDANTPRGAARGGGAPLLELPADVLGLVQLTLAHDAAVLGVPRAQRRAAGKRGQPRRGRPRWAWQRCARRDGGARRPCHHRLIDSTIQVWRDGACERIQAHPVPVKAVASLPRSTSSPARKAPRSCGRSMALRAHLPGRLRVLRRGAARRRALCGRPSKRSGCTTSTGRSSTPSRGTPPR